MFYRLIWVDSQFEHMHHIHHLITLWLFNIYTHDKFTQMINMIISRTETW